MKLRIFIVIFLMNVPLYASATGFLSDVTNIFTTTELDVKYVGKITLGRPYHTEGSFANFTHIPFINEGGKWHGNSAMGYKGTTAIATGSVINFTYQIGLGHKDKINKEIKVRKLDKGEYIVNYQNPDKTLIYVGTINIE